MKTKTNKIELIKNLHLPRLKKDFRFHSFSVLILILFLISGIFYQLYIGEFTDEISILLICSGTILISIYLFIFPIWNLLITLIMLGWVSIFAWLGAGYIPIASIITGGLLLSPCFQMAQHWEKSIILRFGRFSRMKGPGIFFILPIIERAGHFIDTRIRSTDFSAETNLTKDTVPVHVDAIAFWMIWDPRKAVLELQNFMDAVILSAQTALRDAIGKHELSTLLSERDQLGKEIQEILTIKTNPWGITILSIEIRDIIIPKELESAMSKKAQAERERQSRVILGTAEIEISEKFEKASRLYKDNPTALHLRAMNMIYDGLQKNGSIILLPSNAIETMSLGSVIGTTSLAKNSKQLESGKKKKKKKKERE